METGYIFVRLQQKVKLSFLIAVLFLFFNVATVNAQCPDRANVISSSIITFTFTFTGVNCAAAPQPASITIDGASNYTLDFCFTFGGNAEVDYALNTGPSASLPFSVNYNGVTCDYDAAGNILILPITLSSFEAHPQNGEVFIQWTTEDELYNDHMVVERSSDGVKFEDVERVEGAGTTLEAQTYQVVDKAPYNGTSYYRLRQVDWDGTTSWHEIAAVTINEKQQRIVLQPNPSQSYAEIQLAQEAGANATLRLMDSQGKVIDTWAWPVATTQYTLDLESVAKGIYYLEFKDEHYSQTQRLLKL